MGAKRFGVGIVVGLALALGVVASSGLALPAYYGSFSADRALFSVTTQGTTSTVTNVATTATTTAVSTSSTISSTTGTPDGSASGAALTSANSSTTGTRYGPQSTVHNPAPIDALYPSSTNGAAVGDVLAPVNSLASRPSSVAWLVFIPIAVALVLGLALYRSSAGRLAKD